MSIKIIAKYIYKNFLILLRTLAFAKKYYWEIISALFSIAPGAYDVEKSEKIIHQSSGAITFGIKYKDQKPDDIPGKDEFTILKLELFCSINLKFSEINLIYKTK